MTEIDGLLKFDHPKLQSSIIKVLGVGGGGSNAVNHMFRQGIHGVDFIICNTDAQAIETSPVPVKIQLGSSLTEGNGAGSKPEVGKNATIENIEEIREVLSKDTKMVFITAGMGGGTGTGGAPVIAKLAKEMGILTIGIVTIPFSFEGRKRRQLADNGIQELRQNVDTLLVINNDKLRELHGNLVLADAFAKADNILADAAKGIAEIITHVGYINVDFEDVKTVMKDSGVAIMGTGTASGENRAMIAVEQALSSPLLNDNQISGASNVLLYISSGLNGIRLDEVTEITDFIQEEAGSNAEIIWGNGHDDSLGEHVSVTLIATGFNARKDYEVDIDGQRKSAVLVGQLHAQSENRHNLSSSPVTEHDDIQVITKPVATINDPLSVSSSPFREESAPTPPAYHTLETPPPNVSEDQTEGPSAQKNMLTLTMKREGEEPAVKPLNPSNPPLQDLSMKQQDRISRLKELTLKTKSPEGLTELEVNPAYLRRKVELSSQHHSAESEVSRYTLNDGEISNNSFLHSTTD
jgi:cell division protein FtsZ